MEPRNETDLFELDRLEASGPPARRARPGSLGFVRSRGQRLITRIPEIILTLNRRWLVVLVVMAGASVAAWWHVHGQQAVYRGTAQLLLDSSRQVILNQSGLTGAMREDDLAFLRAQTRILESGSVHRKLFSQPQLRGSGGADDLARESLQSRLNELKSQAVEWLQIGAEDPTEEFSEERRMQQTIDGFRARSQVIAHPQSSAIELAVLGTNREHIALELQSWIEAYKSHVEQMERSAQVQYKKIIDRYKEEEELARKALEAFKRDKPQVSQIRLEAIAQRLETLNFELELLQRRRDVELSEVQESVAAPAGSGSAASRPNPERDELLRRKVALELRLGEMQAQEFREDNPDYKEAVQQLELLEKKLSDLPDGTAPVTTDDTGRQEELEKLVQKRRERIRATFAEQEQRVLEEIDRLLTQKATLSEELEQLQEHEKNYERLRERRESYALVMEERSDQIQSLPAKISILDEPQVSVEPHHPLRMMLVGVAGGFLAGLALAFVLEALNPRIRFKQDVTSEFELPCLGVIPKR